MHIGVAIDTSVKPSRDFLLALERIVIERDKKRNPLVLKFFLGSAATTTKNLARFVASGIDAIVFCGMPRRIVFQYLESAPNHPPVVFCTYSAVSEGEFRLMRPCAVVMRDNAAIGRRAADFFIKRGFRNFAFIGRNGNREDIASREREEAFHGRVESEMGLGFRYFRRLIGKFAANEDYWEIEQDELERWIKSLPLPCGIFVNGGLLAFEVIDRCRRLGIDVPGSIEVLGINHNDGFSEISVPSISSITPSADAIASKALDLALELVADPSVGCGSRVEMVDAYTFEERASTSIGRGYGLVASKAKEYIRLNVSRGITVGGVAAALGISRRTLEFRVKEATGSDVRSLIADARMEKICEFLTTTEMPITRVLEASGSPVSSSVFASFKKRFGMPMSEYRKKFSGVGISPCSTHTTHLIDAAGSRVSKQFYPSSSPSGYPTPKGYGFICTMRRCRRITVSLHMSPGAPISELVFHKPLTLPGTVWYSVCVRLKDGECRHYVCCLFPCVENVGRGILPSREEIYLKGMLKWPED